MTDHHDRARVFVRLRHGDERIGIEPAGLESRVLDQGRLIRETLAQDRRRAQSALVRARQDDVKRKTEASDPRGDIVDQVLAIACERAELVRPVP